MKLKKIAATAAMIGGLASAAVGLGAGQANADDNFDIPFFPTPGEINQIPILPPPGQLAQLPIVPPPGHWDEPLAWLGF